MDKFSLHQLGWMKPLEYWNEPPTNWCELAIVHAQHVVRDTPFCEDKTKKRKVRTIPGFRFAYLESPRLEQFVYTPLFPGWRRGDSMSPSSHLVALERLSQFPLN